MATPVDPIHSSSDLQFRYLLTAFLDDLTLDERIDVRRDLNAALAGTASQVERDDIIEFYFRAMPGFDAFEFEYNRRPSWQKYSNCGRDVFLSRWEKQSYALHSGKSVRS